MLMIYVFPGLVTWLPEQLYGFTPSSGTPIQLDVPPEGGFQEDEVPRIAD
jgi:hypothetical protein